MAEFESRGGRVAGVFSGALQPINLSKLDGDARAYVVGNGKRTGHEYLLAYDERTGKTLASHTDGCVDAIGMPPDLRALAADRSMRIVIHHNHPNSLPPSPADLSAVAQFDGVSRAVISGHDGSIYEIAPLQRGNIDRAMGAAAGVLRGALKAPMYVAMGPAERDFVVMAARISALSVAGIIELSWSIDPATGVYANQIEELGDLLYTAIQRSIGR